MGLVFATFADFTVNLAEIICVDLSTPGPVTLSFRDIPNPTDLSTDQSAAARAFFGADRFVSGEQGFRVIVNLDHPLHTDAPADPYPPDVGGDDGAGTAAGA